MLVKNVRTVFMMVIFFYLSYHHGEHHMQLEHGWSVHNNLLNDHLMKGFFCKFYVSMKIVSLTIKT